jgi:atypical dual specificity phosphatase
MGIMHLLTLTAEQPLPAEWTRFRVHHTFIPIPNYGAPTLAEMDAVWARVSAGGSWAVHCGGGVGRAGTVLACIVAMLGRDGVANPSGEPHLDARTAITLLRESRSRSLESEKQVTFVATWVSHRWRIARAAPPLAEPVSPLRTLGDVHSPAAVLLTGRPGSGKSWFARALALRRKVFLIGDEEGRAACETAASRAPRDSLVVLDRCNPSPSDRKTWLALLDRPTVAVHFDYDVQLCAQRVDARLAHPTLRAGRGARALEHMHRALVPPTLAEVSGIMTVSSFAAAREALARLAPFPLAKFPRTPHIFDLGAATPDDVQAQLPSGVLRGHIVVEEKVDGANMGVSLDENGALRVQNRSHWVCAADHAQWRALPRWLETHAEALTALLTDEVEGLPGRYVLYGEWVAARHSVPYARLPGLFVAFDLYDRVGGYFLSRAALARALARTSIPQVPLLATTDSISEAEMRAFLSRTSAFGEERLEGIYVRVEDPQREILLSRGKVVRGDFIAGNAHWVRGPLVLNGIQS